MSKKSTITNLLVIPLIASAIFLANPALAADSTSRSSNQFRHKINVPYVKKGIAGTVTSVNGDIIFVQGRDKVQYTIDASRATIMKAVDGRGLNPLVVDTSDIKVGDMVFVRGAIDDREIDAEKIFDGRMPWKHLKHHFKNHKSIN